jgi:threonine/homoserine/homoserine lactone efflux protein
LIISLILGLLIGFLFSIPPLGPTYFAIIERGLKKEVKNAVAIGVGAGFTDMIYILIAFGGLAAIISLLPDAAKDFLNENENVFKMGLAFIGGIFVVWYGINMIKGKKVDVTKKKEYEKKVSERYEKVESVFKKTEKEIDKILHTKAIEHASSDIKGNFLLGVVFCFSSVTMPASWFAIVGYMKSYGLIDSNFFTGLVLAVGVLIGTSIWFYVMSSIISKNSHKIRPVLISRITSGTGIFLVALGVFFLIKLITMILEL